MSTGIIIQARTGSTRLPNKMILPFYANLGILETILMRLKDAKFEIPIIVATTSNPNDDIIEEIASRYAFVARGSENNVLNRFIYAAQKYNIKNIIRICADNPFLDMNALKYQIKSFENLKSDYWCYSKNDKTPTIKTHYGFWTEGVSLGALKKIIRLTNQKLYQEHVTNYIYSNPEYFNLHFEYINPFIENEANIRLTIDTNDDFEIAKKIYHELLEKQIPFEAIEIIKYIKSRDKWINVMKNQIIANNK